MERHKINCDFFRILVYDREEEGGEGVLVSNQTFPIPLLVPSSSSSTLGRTVSVAVKGEEGKMLVDSIQRFPSFSRK